MITHITAMKNRVIAETTSLVIIDITYPAARNTTPSTARTHFDFGSRSPSLPPLSNSTGCAILMVLMFISSTSRKNTANIAAVNTSTENETSILKLISPPIIFIRISCISFEKTAPNISPAPIEITAVYALSQKSTFDIWRFSIPSML